MPRDDDGRLLGQRVEAVERVVGQLALDADRLDLAAAVAQDEELHLAAAAPMMDPAVELDLLAHVAAEVFDADGTDGGGLGHGHPATQGPPPDARGAMVLKKAGRKPIVRTNQGVAATP